MKRTLIAAGLLLAFSQPQAADDALAGRAVLPADTFSRGPTSGQYLGEAPVNGRKPPFVRKQPVQGFSALLDNHDGSFLAMSDNGFGSLENSADYVLRVYHILPRIETDTGGLGKIRILGGFELRDPDRKIPFAVVNHFSQARVLTGADFDIESMQRAPDGSFWFGDEFGPFLLHTDATGRVLEAPISLPDLENGGELRSPQNPFSEESSTLRVMNAVRAHAQAHRADTRVVMSPWEAMLKDGNPASAVASREAPPAGSGLAAAAGEIHDVALLHQAGFPVVPYTVNDPARMRELLALGVDGLISDRPDLLYRAVADFDANGDGTPGDYLDEDGLIDAAKFDAQGHRGARDLRPENTLPAMEAALDQLMPTLETDNGVTADGVPVLSHDPHVGSQTCRLTSGAPYPADAEVLIHYFTLAELQSRFVCDKLFRGPAQRNDPALSPAAVAFTRGLGLHPYAIPSTEQLFAFVRYYERFYRSGPGRSHPEADRRWKNASRVRFNIETKTNPRAELAARTLAAEPFAEAVAEVIVRNGLAKRAAVQSFDWRTLLHLHKTHPQLQTVFLFGDFPVYADRGPGSGDGANLQDEDGANSPWLAGLPWPYRVTRQTAPFRVAGSGGFEGMAISQDGARLYPLLERPLADGPANKLEIREFDLGSRAYTANRWYYPLDARGTNIGDFVLFNAAREGIVIERDGSQGDPDGFKKLFQIRLDAPGTDVTKSELVDLLNLADPQGISLPARPGDVGVGTRFAMPFVTIEDVVVLGPDLLGVINDNNYPFSVGRHVGAGQPDDTEFVLIKLGQLLKLD